MLFSIKLIFENRVIILNKLKNDPMQLYNIYLNPFKFILKTIFTIILMLNTVTWANSEIDSLKKELTSSPENLKLRHTIAQLYFEKGSYESTVEILKSKAEKLPQESLALLAISYQKLNDSINEIKFLEQLTASYPKYPNGFVMIGDYYYKKSLEKNDPRQSANALLSYKNAIEINPNFKPAYDGLLVAYEKYNNYYELRILLEDMLKRFGKSSQTLTGLCRRNTIDGYFVNARKICSEAINLDNKIPENYVYLSLVENNEGQIAKAEMLLKKVTTDFPKSEVAASNYADFLIQQKNLPGAENLYQQATQGDFNSFRAHIGLATVGFELKHYDSALIAYKNACNVNPHQTLKYLKRAADLLRHRKETNLENRYSSAISKCFVTKDNDRLPASLTSLKEEFRSAFALYSKNKNINLGM